MLASDFDQARNFMVDGQLRPSKVTDSRILTAMRTLPRERFAPPAKAALAYIDEHLEVAPGRYLMKPLVQARLIQLAAPRAGETALIVGAGTGYGAAILAACGVHVIALEQDPALLAIARVVLADTRIAGQTNITLVEGPLSEGWPAQAPYDLVIIEGAVHAIPDKLGRQVAATGRLVTLIAATTGGSYAAIAEPTTGGLAVRPAFEAVAPMLPQLVPAPSFAF
jgi:protein-L-isoaspartate(D-aspartate) O-methyltransferase